MTLKDAKTRREAPLDTPTDLTSNATRDISGALTILLADMFALYVKTKNFHWHMSGPHFRDYHLLLDEQGEQIFATTPIPPMSSSIFSLGGASRHHTPEALKLRHAPIADCARYDQLRRTSYGTDPDLRADERTQALWNEGCLRRDHGDGHQAPA